jgi:hypothetical protein
MGWFGFGGSRGRDDRSHMIDRHGDRPASPGRRYVYEAVCIDRAGKPSRLPENRPRRRDNEDRWARR